MEVNTANIEKVIYTMQRLSWEQGVCAQAMFESYHDEMGIRMADEALHRQTKDGRLGLCDAVTDGVDCGANGLPVWYALLITGDRKYDIALNRMADWFINAEKTKAGIVYHNPNLHRSMIDGIYHLLPMMIVAGKEDFAMDQLRRFRTVHLDLQSHLYAQWWDDDIDDFANPDLWGPGNGWMAGALSLGTLLTKSDVSRKEMKGYLLELIDACIPLIREDGLFHNVLNDADTFPETSTPLMFAYAIYRAVQGNIISDKYIVYADLLFDGVINHIDSDGYVRNACGSPYFNSLGIAAEAQGFAIMCNNARKEIKNGKGFRFKQ